VSFDSSSGILSEGDGCSMGQDAHAELEVGSRAGRAEGKGI
jgi:hypothetical protein